MKRAFEAKMSPVFSQSFPIRLALRSDLHLARKAWHVIMGMVIVAIYLAGMPRSTGVLTLGFFLGLDLLVETVRLKVPTFNEKFLKICSPILRSCEVNRMSGTPYYISAAIIAVGIFPKPIAVLSILYLACGDPAASLFGIIYGKKSPKLSNGKSLIGTSAGVVVCSLITFFYLSSMHLPGDVVVALSLIGGVAGGAAELLPLDIDDNFSIPIVSGFLLWLAFILVGI